MVAIPHAGAGAIWALPRDIALEQRQSRTIKAKIKIQVVARWSCPPGRCQHGEEKEEGHAGTCLLFRLPVPLKLRVNCP